VVKENGRQKWWENVFPDLNTDFFQLLHEAYHNNKKIILEIRKF